MDWGIPMWFLLAIINTFLFFGLARKIKNKILHFLVLIMMIALGFALPHVWKIKYPWSIDVALVSLIYYAFGYYIFPYLLKLNKRQTITLVIVMGILHFSLFHFNSKVDMYRSQYGHIFWFVINGLTGSLFYLLLLKWIKNIPFLSYIGQYTIPILAMQLRAMTVIKVILALVFGYTVFHFNEYEKFIFAIIQIILMIPVFYIIDKYFPLLNGKSKKI